MGALPADEQRFENRILEDSVMSKMVLVGICILSVSTLVLGAPSLEITKPPVTPVPSGTGPLEDPDAIQGQWFNDSTVRPYEFYDNLYPTNGGGIVNKDIGGVTQNWGSTNAIYGKAQDVTLEQGNITSFKIKAVITNDTPGFGPWLPGQNSHGESLDTQNQYAGTLVNARLTAEFAIRDLNTLPTSWTSPYTDRQPYIIADNENGGAWYCWTPGGQTPTGDYFVPYWDLGTIPQGSSVIKELVFSVSGAGLDPTDPRYSAILASESAAWGLGDLFLNRTTDLKLGDWIDTLAPDTGEAYPSQDILRSGNVSVFHTPEPATALLFLGGLARLLRRRR
jgi:hypothetical protein